MGFVNRPRPLVSSVLLALVGSAFLFSPPSSGQTASLVKLTAGSPAKRLAAPQGYRKLAPGIEQTIPPDAQEEETYSRHDVVELLAVDKGFDWSKDIAFRRDIWALEFTFKPMRMIWVDVPQPSGKMQRKLIWYLVYHVQNKGQHLHPVADAKGVYTLQKADTSVRFVPQFLLESREYKKVYPDRIIPAALEPIRQREDPKRPLLNTVQIIGKIPFGGSVWGVATWEDLDPRIDTLSVYVLGLTNAYKWIDERATPADPQSAYKYRKGDPLGTARRSYRKALQLNFWRPGDEFSEREQAVRFGMPGEVDYRWVYR
jgi:hypothetical protein